jgi:nucleoid-associated protein YgaU
MLDRNGDRDVFLNDHKLYRKLLKDRGINSFRHFSKLKLGTVVPSEIKDLTVIDHTYTASDSLAKLAHKYYGDTRYWWVIGWFNKKPIDNLYTLGETVHIPLPLEEILYYAERENG